MNFHNPAAIVPNNATSVVYTDENGQLLDTLQICRDFKYGQCVRPACKFVHLLEDHVEVTDMKVSVCRDAVKGRCGRGLCKSGVALSSCVCMAAPGSSPAPLAALARVARWQHGAVGATAAQ
ncbi:hypothetical protein Pcinc_019889 [Petrolisthes cinctipes]|uniref:C3H1-type domain-containing protein n=1 Tax=Petrolisthes cinctipes TaxID=88211 RepID=A0AAE1KKI9_PETCI|nr:hypothetical protein Pcinc_019889 [Petrolisthes cinctipes]